MPSDRNTSRLVNRNIDVPDGRRTSMRLAPEYWDALHNICIREQCTAQDIVRQITQMEPRGPRTLAMRLFILRYYKAAATEKGHAAAGHGVAEGMI